jgi:hypothetical protein
MVCILALNKQKLIKLKKKGSFSHFYFNSFVELYSLNLSFGKMILFAHLNPSYYYKIYGIYKNFFFYYPPRIDYNSNKMDK